MRVLTLVILLAVVGGIGFVFYNDHTRNWIFSKSQEAAFLAEGYTYAPTPREAMEQFHKAIKNRNYKAAARYVSDDYAKVLIKAHTAGNAIGTKLDRIYNKLHEDGSITPMVLALLVDMDPFPATFKIKEAKVSDKDKDKLAFGLYEWAPIPVPTTGRSLTEGEAGMLDGRLMGRFCLQPDGFVARNMGVYIFQPFEIKKDSKGWKMSFQPRTDDAEYFIETYKRYDTAYDKFLDDVIREKKLRDAVGPDLLSVLRASKN